MSSNPPFIQRPPINRVPQSLLTLLDMRNGGANPADLSNVVGGVLDLEDWYLRPQRIHLVTAGVTAIPDDTSGFFSLITVPQQEWWFVNFAQCNMARGGGTAGIFDCAFGFRSDSLRPPIIPPNTLYGSVNPAGVTMVNVLRATRSVSQPFWVGPGYQLGFELAYSEIPGPGSTADIAAFYVPLRV